MSLLAETIRDAYRPVSNQGAGQQRILVAGESTQSSPEEQPALTDVGQFQKEGQPSAETGLREASLKSGAADTSFPADDPLLVESKVERPNLFTPDVNGNEDIFSVKGDNQGNELATGQSNHGSPTWTTAAKMSAVSRTYQSEVMSELKESDSAHQRHQSREQGGSERTVSEREETYQSRIPGQGAPSDSSFTAPITPLRSVLPGPTPVDRPHVPGLNPGPAEAAPGHAVEFSTAVPGQSDEYQSGQRGQEAVSPVSSYLEEHLADRGTFAPSSKPESQSSTPASPNLVIGRIDVVVVAETPQAGTRASVRTRSDSGFVSRNYLKRL